MKKPYRLYNGDCFEILKDFPENTFDMVFADPPYMLSNGGITRLFWKDMQPIRITLQALFQNKETGYVEKF